MTHDSDDLESLAWPSSDSPWPGEEYEPDLVSVVIPTCNRSGCLLEAMDSVWTQTYRPIELIVVDDGSTDDTRHRAMEWGDRHQTAQFAVRYIRQPNRGVSAARNRGAGESNGEFIIWHDSDDLMLPDRVAAAMSSIKARAADLCVCGFAASKDRMLGGSFYRPPPAVPDPVEAYAMGRLHVSSIIWMYRRSFLAHVEPWCERLVRAVDQYFNQDCLCREPPPGVSTCPEVLCLARRVPGSSLSHRYQSREDYVGRLGYFEGRLKTEPAESSPSFLRKLIVRDCLEAAIYSHRTFPELSTKFLDLANRHGPDVKWGRSWMHRLIWSLGGVSACHGAVYAANVLRRLMDPRAQWRIDRLRKDRTPNAVPA